MVTELRFTGQVDHRYAWIGNEAAGSIDLATELVAFINGASTSLAVSSMTFSLEAVGDALAAAAAAGRTVRIVGNAGHRYQQGWFRAQRGPVQIVDNNLPALVVRVSFQQSGATVPTGFLVDSGLPFGARGGGWSYGWNTDVSGDISLHSAPASFSTPLLGQCYAKGNATQRTWSIVLPAGHYYVVAVVGEANYNSKTYLRGQGQTIFTYKNSSGLHYSDYTDCAAGEFGCSIADGGSDDTSGEPQGRWLDVTSGTLTLTVGQGSASATTWSSLDYIEIYRASDAHPLGDPGTDKSLVQERQLHHTKFILRDAGTPSARLWTGSHNLTPIDLANPRSEDALVTDEPAICAAFAAEFDQWWGASSGAPVPGSARLGRFKIPANADGTMAGVLTPGIFPWRLRFSPSTSTAPGVDMYQVVADHLNGATEDVLLLMEQLSDSGDFGGYHGTTWLMNHVLDPASASGIRVMGLFGNKDSSDSVFSRYGSPPDAAVQSTTTHDKMALVDAMHDTRQRGIGRLLCGSMNWSQSAMHVNDEQTLVFGDPALANQALQRAMAGFDVYGIQPEEPADIIIVIDRSYSMTAACAGAVSKMAAARDAADTLLDMLTADGTHRVALVRFGVSVEPFTPPETLVPFTATRRTALHALVAATDATLPIGNATCYGLALQVAQSLLSAGTAHPRQVVAFLTDGKENTAPYASGIYQPMAAAGIELHTTAFGAFDPFATGGPNGILCDMATASGGTFAQVDDDAIHLQKRFAEVARDAMGMVTLADPGWDLAPGQKVTMELPVDLDRGVIQWCALWGGGPAGAVTMTLRTPSGTLLSARSAGVSRLRGEGREIWRVDLARLSRKERTIGTWTVALAAPRKLRARTHVALAVYASRGGADLRVELAPEKDGLVALARVLDGAERVLPEIELFHTPPVLSREARPVTLHMAPLHRQKAPGVLAARPALKETGTHTLRVVAKGKGARGPFRREAVVHVTVPRRRSEG